MTKLVREVKDPLRKVFKDGCPKCESVSILFTMRNPTPGFHPADLVRCPKYLGGCGFKMTKEKCVEVHGNER